MKYPVSMNILFIKCPIYGLLSMKFPSMKYLSTNEMSKEFTLNTVIYLSSAGVRIDR